MQQIIADSLEITIADIVKRNLTTEAYSWLHEKTSVISTEKNAAQLNLTFAAVPRKTGKQLITLTDEDKEKLKAIHPLFTIQYWTIDRIARVWVLLQVDSSDKENYFRKLENLFKAAEMNELAALYSAMIGFHYPEDWQRQCAEGIRSNIGFVLEAIMYNNPYPAQYLCEGAWNQLVLKAFFTEKDVKRIIGLDERANKELAAILVDYANERWAAHRAVHPQLWRLVSPFIDAENFSNIEKALNSKDAAEKQAAALAAYYSPFEQAKRLLEKEPELKLSIVENNLNWNSL